MDRRAWLAALGASGLMTVMRPASACPPPVAQPSASPAADAGSPADAAPPTGPRQITVAQLHRWLLVDGINPFHLRGCELAANARIVEFAKFGDMGRVAVITFEDWPAGKDIYGTAWLENIHVDGEAEAAPLIGRRVEVRALIAEQGYGRLFLRLDSWRLLDDRASPPAAPGDAQ